MAELQTESETMSKLSPERRKIVVLCATVACMSSGPLLLRGHRVLQVVWLAVMVVELVYAVVLLAQLKGRG